MLKVSTDKMDSIQDEALDLSLPKIRKRDDVSFNTPSKRPDATPGNGSHIGGPKPEAMSFNDEYQPLEHGLNSRNTCKQERDDAISKPGHVDETKAEASEFSANDMRMSNRATEERDAYSYTRYETIGYSKRTKQLYHRQYNFGRHRQHDLARTDGLINAECGYNLSSARALTRQNEEATPNTYTEPDEIETVVINDQEEKKHEDGTSNNSFRWDTFTGDQTIACRSLSTRSNSGSPNTSVSDVGDYCHDPLQKDDSEPEAEASNNSDVIHRRIGCITISLQDSHLWRAFANRGTEMIINKGGRRMFPRVLISINGLEPETQYSVALELSSADDRRYKFINNQWMTMGRADPQTGTQSVTHQDSPSSGRFWQHSLISFAKVRLTNNKDAAEGNILLQSMHKYTSNIVITNLLTGERETTFEFPEVSFIAVTAYQNSEVTELKIQNNPFAKAFIDRHCSPSFGGKIHGRKSQTKRAKSFPYGHEAPRKDTAPMHSVPELSAQWLYKRHPALGRVRIPRRTTDTASSFLQEAAYMLHPYVPTLIILLPKWHYMALGQAIPPTLQMWLKDPQQLYRSLFPSDNYLRQQEMNDSTSRERDIAQYSRN